YRWPVESPPSLKLPSIWMVRRWYGDGVRMARGESEKTEKITINLGLVDLGQIDLLVQEGFYANRTDFIRTAIRTQLATRGEALDQTAARRTLTLGSSHYTPRDLEGGPRGRADDPYPGAGAGELRRRCLPPAGPGHDCLSGGARRLPGPRRGEGRPGASYRLSLRDGNQNGCPDHWSGSVRAVLPAAQRRKPPEGTPA